MNQQILFKALPIALAMLLTGPAIYGQSPAQNAGQKPAKQTEEAPVKSKTDQPVKGQNVEPDALDAESIDAITKETTADQCRAYAEKRANWVSEQVGGIEPAQRKRVYDIFNKAYLDIRDMRKANPGADKTQLRTRARARLDKAKSDAVAVLNPEQQAKLDAWRDRRGATLKDQSMHRAETQTRNLDAVVGLDENQKKQVLDLNTELWKESSAWRSNNPNATADQKRAYAKEVQRKRMEGYRNLLSPAQQEAYKASLKGRMETDGMEDDQ